MQDEVTKAAISNYSSSMPWPKEDIWHSYTFFHIKRIVEQWLADFATDKMLILNAGSGGTEYNTRGELIHLDVIEKYICSFNKYIVGSIENIDLPDSSVDGIICVGSVLNYADAQRSISEFSRVLKPSGFLILEFERSNSAEFLCTKNYGKYIFRKDYLYNQQMHLLWMYSEKHIRCLLENNNISISKNYRIHNLSSLLYRLGVPEPVAARYSICDSRVQLLSYYLAHNVILLGFKSVNHWLNT